MTILSKNNQSGRSMVEMLGVLAIIGVLSVGGISGYSKAMAKYKLTKAQDQITMLLMNIRAAYATSPNYNGLDSPTVVSYNLVPGEMINGSGSNTVLYGAFGGKVEVKAISGNTNFFYITIHGLGKEACRSLATSDWGADGLISETIAKDAENPTISATCTPGESRPTSGAFCTKWLPVKLTDLGTSAGKLCGEERNMITWVYN